MTLIRGEDSMKNVIGIYMILLAISINSTMGGMSYLSFGGLHGEDENPIFLNTDCPYCLTEVEGEGKIGFTCGHACHSLCAYRHLCSMGTIKKFTDLVDAKHIVGQCPLCRRKYVLSSQKCLTICSLTIKELRKTDLEDRVKMMDQLPYFIARDTINEMTKEARKALFRGFNNDKRYALLFLLPVKDWNFFITSLEDVDQIIFHLLAPSELTFMEEDITVRTKLFAELDLETQRSIIQTFWQDFSEEERAAYIGAHFETAKKHASNMAQTVLNTFTHCVQLQLSTENKKTFLSKIGEYWSSIGTKNLHFFIPNTNSSNAALRGYFISEIMNILPTIDEKATFLKSIWATLGSKVCIPLLKDIIVKHGKDIRSRTWYIEDFAEEHVRIVKNSDEHFYDFYDAVREIISATKSTLFLPLSQCIWETIPFDDGQRYFAHLDRDAQKMLMSGNLVCGPCVILFRKYHKTLDAWWQDQPRSEKLKYLCCLPKHTLQLLHKTMTTDEKKTAFAAITNDVLKTDYLVSLPRQTWPFYAKHFPAIVDLFAALPDKIFCYTDAKKREKVLRAVTLKSWGTCSHAHLHHFIRKYELLLSKKEQEIIFCKLWENKKESASKLLCGNIFTITKNLDFPKKLFAFLGTEQKKEAVKIFKETKNITKKRYSGIKRGATKARFSGPKIIKKPKLPAFVMLPKN